MVRTLSPIERVLTQVRISIFLSVFGGEILDGYFLLFLCTLLSQVRS